VQPGTAERANNQQEPSSFAVGYSGSAGEPLVYGGVIIGVICLVLSIAAQRAEFAIAAVVSLSAAYWYYPLVERNSPQLGANARGLYISRIGFLDWSAIGRMELFETSVRSIRLYKLKIFLNRPLDDAVAEPELSRSWKTFMTRNWTRRRTETGDLIEVDLHPLAGVPGEILQGLRAYRNV